MKIEDNFLDQKEFDNLQKRLMGDDFAWFYTDGIDYGIEDSNGVWSFPEEGDKNKFQFIHMFYTKATPCSPHYKELLPIFERIQLVSLWCIKANLLTKTPNIVENTFHVDNGDLKGKKLKQWTTAIFYVNTNNGYTKFEDGTKVESVANRMLSFPANMKHCGSSCTNEKRRIVINLNYFENIPKE